MSKARVIFSSKCAVGNSKKSRFVENQEAIGLLKNLGIKKITWKHLILKWRYIVWAGKKYWKFKL